MKEYVLNESVDIRHLRVYTKGLSMLRTNPIIHKCMTFNEIH